MGVSGGGRSRAGDTDAGRSPRLWPQHHRPGGVRPVGSARRGHRPLLVAGPLAGVAGCLLASGQADPRQGDGATRGYVERGLGERLGSLLANAPWTSRTVARSVVVASDTIASFSAKRRERSTHLLCEQLRSWQGSQSARRCPGLVEVDELVVDGLHQCRGAWMSAPGDTVWATGSSTCGGGILNAAGALRPASRYRDAWLPVKPVGA